MVKLKQTKVPTVQNNNNNEKQSHQTQIKTLNILFWGSSPFLASLCITLATELAVELREMKEWRIYTDLYNKLSYARILIGSHL